MTYRKCTFNAIRVYLEQNFVYRYSIYTVYTICIYIYIKFETSLSLPWRLYKQLRQVQLGEKIQSKSQSSQYSSEGKLDYCKKLVERNRFTL